MRLIFPLVLCGLLLACAGPAQAHRVSVYAYVENGQIKGEGYMPGGGKVSNQPVQLLDAGGKVLAEGKTKPDGSFAIPLPQAKPPLRVVLTAGPGHRAEYELKATDLGQAAQASASAPAAPTAPAATATPLAGVDLQALGALVQQKVEKGLAPMRAQLAEMALHSQEVSLKDIVGGLGWIVGLLGLAAFYKARKMARGA